MPTKGKYLRPVIKLSKSKRQKIEALLWKGAASVRVVKRAQIVRLLDKGYSPPEAADAIGVSAKTVRDIRRRYIEMGLDAALYEAPRQGHAPALNQKQSCEIILNIYEKPFDPKEPVVCLDERPVQLLADARKPVPAKKPGQIKKQDSEYIRRGTANVFCAIEGKAGKHFTFVTRNRKGPEFAKAVNKIATQYPTAKTIHLVLDNLNTHKEKSLTDFYGEKRGEDIWKRFFLHYTPKHGSWLNQAEIEIGIYSKQCLGKDRIAGIDELRKRSKAWNRRINFKKTKIDWKFTTKSARKKFKYK